MSPAEVVDHLCPHCSKFIRLLLLLLGKVEKETITMQLRDGEFREGHCLAGIPLTLTLLHLNRVP